MSKLVLIIGANGSGKSTVMRNIIGEESETFVHPLGGKYTVSKNRKLITLGKYDNQCGGCDGIKTTFLVYNMVDALTKEYPDYDIYFEGILISGIFANVAKLLMEMLFERKREVHVCLLYTNSLTSVTRVLKRNGGKNINQDGIVDRVEGSQTAFRKHRELGLYDCRAFDSINVPASDIASQILAL